MSEPLDDDILYGDADCADESYACVACTRLIGDEVCYGDDWGEGPLCSDCAGISEDT